MAKRERLGGLSLTAAVPVTAGLPSVPAHAQETEMIVFAAASSKNALDVVNTQRRQQTGCDLLRGKPGIGKPDRRGRPGCHP